MSNTFDGTHQYRLIDDTAMDQDTDTVPDSAHGAIRAPHRVSISNIEINVESVNQSLASVNTFATKRNEKLQPILLYEISSFGESTYKSMTLRELLHYLNDHAEHIDEEFELRMSNQFNPMGFESQIHGNSLSFNPVPVTPSFPVAPPRTEGQPQLEPPSRSNRRRGSVIGVMNPRGSQQPAGGGRSSTIGSVSNTSNNSSFLQQNASNNGALVSDVERVQGKRRSSILRLPSTFNTNAPINSPDGDYHPLNIVKSLRLRDLRRLDTTASLLNETSVIVRRHAVVFSMNPIRAVIMADKVILVVPDGADSLIAILDQYMKEWVNNRERTTSVISSSSITHDPQNGPFRATDLPAALRNRRHRKPRRMNVDGHAISDIPFEIHAYEALLLTVKELESQQVNHLADRMEELLIYYRQGTLIPISIQSELRQIKNDLTIISARLDGCDQALQYVVEDNDEMALMNLSLLNRKPSLYRFPLDKEIFTKHDEIEELIESYAINFKAITSKISHLKTQIQSAEDLVSVRLDTAQNRLLLANTALLITTCSIAFGGYIVGAFGMNLDQTIYIQPVNGTFAYVSSGSFGVMFIVFAFIFGYLKLARILPENSTISSDTFSALFSSFNNHVLVVVQSVFSSICWRHQQPSNYHHHHQHAGHRHVQEFSPSSSSSSEQDQ